MLSDIVLSIVMPSIEIYECRQTEYHHADYRNAEYHHTEYSTGECRHAECNCVECCGTFRTVVNPAVKTFQTNLDFIPFHFCKN
jgi:hypothetical protein